MNGKTLTISVAAYNVEKYIETTLLSLTRCAYIDEIEVLVIDDGGKDGTVEIARRYACLYPDSIKVIHKENGGYGSTVNYSMKNASGKYLKLLDGDDWYETASLDLLIPKLRELNSDVVVTDYKRCFPDKTETVSYSKYFQSDSEVKLSKQAHMPLMHMWALMFKTEIIREANFALPEKVFYSDVMFATLPFAKAATLSYFNLPVYNYRCGRDEQSVSKSSRIKHYKDAVIVTQDEARYFERQKNCNNCNNREYIRDRIAVSYLDAVKTLMYLPSSKENLGRIITCEQEMRTISDEIFHRCLHCSAGRRMALSLGILRSTKYKMYRVFKKTGLF